MESVLTTGLEQGLGLQTTKIGSGDKDPAYTISQQRFRWFCTGIFSSFFLLLVLVIVYASLYDDERIRRMFEKQESLEKITEEKLEGVKLSLLMSQQHSSTNQQVEDAKRTLHRISFAINSKFDEFIAFSQPQELTQAKLTAFRNEITRFVDQEIKAFSMETDALIFKQNDKLAKLNHVQDQSLRDLMSSLGVHQKVQFGQILLKVFAEAKRVKIVKIHLDELKALEELLEWLYEGKVSEAKASKLLDKIQENKSWRISQSNNSHEIGNELEQLIYEGKLSRGRKEIGEIEAEFMNSKKTVEDHVDAIMKIHELVAEGKVPEDLMDFSSLVGDDEDELKEEAQN